MKQLLLLSILFLFISCEENNMESQLSGMKAEAFTEKIAGGNYERNFADSLPGFKPQDIPIFLNHCDDFKEISYFPPNPVSSLTASPKLLGECLLWTIEAIRLTPATANSLNYPSLVPTLVKEETIDNEKVLTRLNKHELFQAYQLYKIWWDQAQDKTFEELRNTDPLEGSGFQWR